MNYIKLKQLGNGSFGSVYLIKMRVSRKEYALHLCTFKTPIFLKVFILFPEYNKN